VPKCFILVTIFQKFGGSPPPAPLSLRFWWPKVAWFGQIVVFQTDYGEIKTLKNQLRQNFSDVIDITSTKNVTKSVTKFFYLGPPPSKISGYASVR